MTSLGQTIIPACDAHGDKIAVADEGERLTYREFRHFAQEIADGLARRGLVVDEPVILPVSNKARDLAAFYGIWFAGGVVVPVHRGATDRTARDLIERTRARFLVNARPELETPGSLKTASNLVLSVGSAPPPRRAILDAAAMIVFTSGTTGEPKGVVQTHARYTAKLDAIQSVLPISDAERMLIVLQLVFAFAHWTSFLTLANGGTVIFREKFDPETLVETLAGEAVTTVPLVPTMMRLLAPLMEEAGCACFEGRVISGGEPLPAPVGRMVRRAWPDAALWDFFGLTETCTSDFIVRAPDYDGQAGSIGRAAPGVEFRITDPEGELQIRTPHIMAGYLDAPELTAAAFDGDWFRTGDLARERPDGAVELIGRAKDLVVRAGIKIAPIEVERAFLEHPEIEAALAAGAPDPVRGEAVHILIVPRAGAKLDADALEAWSRDRLDRHKLPDRIHLGDRIPVGRTGKADRRALAQMILSGEL